ncbi:MAG: biopolymer transporter ExbD, partial [Candidatus Protistobacter heckmanni]|nr:biopolymer transporter ExbD [Candidatus Protistobacter heckmanni]
MAYGNFDNDDEVMSEINMTPLVDVMLVLLIVFMITIPVIRQAVKVQLPRATSQPDQARPEVARLAIDAGGQVFWNNVPVDDAALQARLQQAAQTAQSTAAQPELQLRADRNVRYERVAQVMAAAQRNGLAKIGFVTEPPP